MSWSLYDPNPDPDDKNIGQIATLLASIGLTALVVMLCL